MLHSLPCFFIVRFPSSVYLIVPAPQEGRILGAALVERVVGSPAAIRTALEGMRGRRISRSVSSLGGDSLDGQSVKVKGGGSFMAKKSGLTQRYMCERG